MAAPAGTKDKLSLLKGKKPRETTHHVVLDHEAVDAYAQARHRLKEATDALRAARRHSEPDTTMAEVQAAYDQAKAEADELEAAAEDGVVTVKIRAMPPLEYAALKAEFPPTEDDHKRVRTNLDDEKAKAAWNQDEFAPRLLARCIIDPQVTLDDVRGFYAAWGAPDWNFLVAAAVRVHEQTVDTSSLVFSSGRTRN
jgi:hypothetical protein